jgi:hypothetical protein
MGSLLIALAAAPTPAHAEVIYELVPSISFGVTNNARVTATRVPMMMPAPGTPPPPPPLGPQADSFLTGGGSMRLRYVAARSAHAIGYRVSYTHFLLGRGVDLVSNEIGETSTFNLSPVLLLKVGAGVVLSHASGLALTGTTVQAPQATLGGSSLFLVTSANEETIYEPSAKIRYAQSFLVSRVDYLDITPPVSPITLIAASGRRTWLEARQSIYLDAQLGDTISTVNGPGPFASGHTFLGQVTLGWRREFSPTWGGSVEAGPMAIFKVTGPAVIAPAAAVTANFTRLPWYASLVLSQAPTPNLFLGQATITDGALLRLALPLSRSELFFVTGYGGYSYARVANNQLQLSRAYDSFNAGASITARIATSPLWAALQYTIIDQRGGTLVGGGTVPSLLWWTGLVTVGGAFAWGPGTPPLFGGVP